MPVSLLTTIPTDSYTRGPAAVALRWHYNNYEHVSSAPPSPFSLCHCTAAPGLQRGQWFPLASKWLGSTQPQPCPWVPRALSLAQPWQAHYGLPTAPANRRKCTSSPRDALHSANERQVACCVQSRQRRTHPTAAQTHIPEATWGDMTSSVHAQDPPAWTSPRTPRWAVEGCWEQLPAPAPTTALPVMGRWTGPWAWAGGQPEPESLGGTVGSRAVVPVGRMERMGRSRHSLPSI